MIRLIAQVRSGGSMKVGVPSEVKSQEYRVAITPAGVNEFTQARA